MKNKVEISNINRQEVTAELAKILAYETVLHIKTKKHSLEC